MSDAVFFATILALFLVLVGHPYLAAFVFFLGIMSS